MVLLRYCVDGSAAMALICKGMMAEILRSAKEEVAARLGFLARQQFFNRRPSQSLVFILSWDPRMVFRSGTFGFNRNALKSTLLVIDYFIRTDSPVRLYPTAVQIKKFKCDIKERRRFAHIGVHMLPLGNDKGSTRSYLI